jgi:hypothetical protein
MCTHACKFWFETRWKASPCFLCVKIIFNDGEIYVVISIALYFLLSSKVLYRYMYFVYDFRNHRNKYDKVKANWWFSFWGYKIWILKFRESPSTQLLIDGMDNMIIVGDMQKCNVNRIYAQKSTIWKLH